MRFLKGLFWLLLAIALLAGALYATIHFQLSDRVATLFLQAQPWLPLELSGRSLLAQVI
jgi:hypothetical protein